MTPASAATTKMKAMMPKARRIAPGQISLFTPVAHPLSRWWLHLRAGGRADHLGAVGHVASDDGASARNGVPSHPHGRDEHRAAADKGAIFDHRLVLVLAVVVASDCARADVDIAADPCVADVAEVADLCAGAKTRRLDFDEIADVDVLLQVGAGAQVAEGADVHSRLQCRALDHGGEDHAFVADSAVGDDGVGADAAALADDRVAGDRGVRVDAGLPAHFY